MYAVKTLYLCDRIKFCEKRWNGNDQNDKNSNCADVPLRNCSLILHGLQN